jgi:hypothetical protein
MAAQVEVADVPTEEYAQAMEEAIDAATKAEAEANRLKRKYEPDEPEVLMDKILQLADTYYMNFMRVQIFTGEYMQLTLIPIARRNRNVPDWTFRPHLTDANNNMIDFGHYGIWQVYVGDGTLGCWLVVTFDNKGVSIRPVVVPDDSDLRISAVNMPEFALTHE